MPELREVYLRLSLALNPPWWNPLPGQDPFQGAEPLSFFWQAQFLVLSLVGMVLFMLWIAIFIMPEAMEWIHTIRPYLERSLQEHKDWRNKRKD